MFIYSRSREVLGQGSCNATMVLHYLLGQKDSSIAIPTQWQLTQKVEVDCNQYNLLLKYTDHKEERSHDV